MREKISFLILTHQGSNTRQLVTSKKTVRILSLSFIGILISGLAIGGYFIHDYRNLQKSVAGMQSLENRIASQQEELSDQHRQIQVFASKINMLKEELIALKEYETRVREISNIKDTKTTMDKKTKAGKNSFGVGGPLPEDIDTELNLKDKHSRLIDEMHLKADQLKLASVRQTETIKDLIDALLEKKKRTDCTPSMRPVKGMITSKFGYRRSEFSGKKEYHKGCDIGAPKGTPIMASADGVVKFSGRRSSFGNVIVIDHGYGYRTYYAHIYKLLKKKGDRVKKGDVIALVGNTGRSTGPHVHYEVHKNGIPVNPAKYFHSQG